MRVTCCALLALSLAGGPAVAAPPAFSVRIEATPNRVADSDNPKFEPASQIAAAPDGRVILVPWGLRPPIVLDPRRAGDPVALSTFGLEPEIPVQMAAGSSDSVLIATTRGGLIVAGQDWKIIRRVPTSRLSAHGGAAAVGRMLFGVGTASEGKMSEGRAATRLDCIVFTLDLADRDAGPVGRVCDAVFSDATFRSVFPFGHTLVSRDRKLVYVVADGWPNLVILDAATGKTARTVPLPGAAPSTPTTPDLRMKAMRDPGFFYDFRAGFRWVQGIVHGPGDAFGVLFRQTANGVSKFTMDFFDRNGALLAGAIPIGLERTGSRAHARVASTPDAQYLLINEPKGDFTSVQWQKLYRLQITPGATVTRSAKK